MRDAVGHLLAEAVGKTLPFRIITGAHFGGEGETGRHRQADRGHLRQIRALTAEEVPVPGLALRDAAAEAEDIADSDRKSVVKGKSVAVSVDLGGRRHIKKKTQHTQTTQKKHKK